MNMTPNPALVRSYFALRFYLTAHERLECFRDLKRLALIFIVHPAPLHTYTYLDTPATGMARSVNV